MGPRLRKAGVTSGSRDVLMLKTGAAVVGTEVWIAGGI